MIEGGIEEAVSKLWKEIGIQARIEDVREINKRREGGKKMVLVRMIDKEGKSVVMRKKGGLKGKEERMTGHRRRERCSGDWKKWRERRGERTEE